MKNFWLCLNLLVCGCGSGHQKDFPVLGQSLNSNRNAVRITAVSGSGVTNIIGQTQASQLWSAILQAEHVEPRGLKKIVGYGNLEVLFDDNSREVFRVFDYGIIKHGTNVYRLKSSSRTELKGFFRN